MAEHIHHVHLFARDLAATVAWYGEVLGGIVRYDGEFAGVRNVFMTVGSGRLHFYDQPPRGEGRNAIHHVGIRTDDLAGVIARLRRRGGPPPGPVRDFGAWRYLMCEGPDGVLLELFEVDGAKLPPALAAYFGA